ncbi:hypothetical protein AB0B45_44965 [Nonomuraea sp. NPDC049152]|uniref:hypothetical protein n=1 Tax=Nonomuraea sp. NPDC049152 TaxID=3154350 RepID=UPI0033CF2A1D
MAKCDWIRRGHALCPIGDSGTGKSHLLIALSMESAIAGPHGRVGNWATWNSTNAALTCCFKC